MYNTITSPLSVFRQHHTPSLTFCPYHAKIKVEEPYKPKNISQCINCQDYGRTESYCHYPVRCVCYSAHHASADWSNPRDALLQNALSALVITCYKGCFVYRDLQLRKKLERSTFLSDNIYNKNGLYKVAVQWKPTQ